MCVGGGGGGEEEGSRKLYNMNKNVDDVDMNEAAQMQANDV